MPNDQITVTFHESEVAALLDVLEQRDGNDPAEHARVRLRRAELDHELQAHDHRVGRPCSTCADGAVVDTCWNCGNPACDGCPGPTDDEIRAGA